MSIVIDGTGTISGVSATGITTAQTVSASNITTGTLPFGQLPTGSVLQAVTTNSSAVDISASGNVLSLAITPKFSTSKVLVIATAMPTRINGSTSNNCLANMRRGATDIFSFTNAVAYLYATSQRLGIAGSYIDSPATTSSTTYSIYADLTNASGASFTFYTPTLTLLEIAG